MLRWPLKRSNCVSVATGHRRIQCYRVTDVLTLLAALLALNSALTFQNVWPTPGIRWVPEFSVELVTLLLVLLGAAVRGKVAGKLMRRVLVGGYLLFVIGRYLDAVSYTHLTLPTSDLV